MTDKEYDKKVMKLLKNPFAEPDEEMQEYLRKMEEDIEIRKELKKDAKERLKAIYGERKKGEYTVDEFIEFLHNNYPVKIATLADFCKNVKGAKKHARYPINVYTDRLNDLHCVAIYRLPPKADDKDVYLLLESHNDKLTDWYTSDNDDGYDDLIAEINIFEYFEEAED